MRDCLLVSADLGRHIAWLAEYKELGLDELQLHQVGGNQREFIEAFGTHVLPAFEIPKQGNVVLNASSMILGMGSNRLGVARRQPVDFQVGDPPAHGS